MAMVVKYLVAKSSASSEVSRWLRPGGGRCTVVAAVCAPIHSAVLDDVPSS